MRTLAVLVAALSLAVTACDPGAREAEPFAGIWESDGWGTFLLIEGGDVEIFEHSAIHCLSVAAGGARGVTDILSWEGERLVMEDADRVVRFDRIEVLPPRCIDAGGSSDPVDAVTVLAATVEEQMIAEVDDGWPARRAAVTAELPGPVGDDALFDALVELVAPLGGKVELADPAGRVWPERSEIDPPPDAAMGGRDGYAIGTIDGTVGYLGLARVGPFDPDPVASQRLLAAELDTALQQGVFVLDLRQTAGGVLDHALLIATRFVTDSGVVASLEARAGAAAVAAGDLSVTAWAGGPYSGEVFVLVGPETRGVAELLAFIMGELPGVTLVGAPTAGVPGPPLVRFMPNGWSFAVPNLRVVAPDGRAIGSIDPGFASDSPLADALAG